MAIPAATLASYAPWGNAQLAFEVGSGTATTDPATGNPVQTTETLEYLASLSLQAPSWKPESGVDSTVYTCRGRLLSPSTSSRIEVNGHTFRVGPRSFWQSHRDAPAVLTDAVLGVAGVKPGDTVTDLYAGVGLFSVPLAKATGRGGRVTAVESAPWSVADARHNVEGAGRVQVRQWDVTARAVNDAVAPDSIVVVDPPRTGLGRGVAAALARRAPRRLVYVSCDPATFARDLSALLMGGFALGDLRAFDLFPMTEHVELVARLDFIG